MRLIQVWSRVNRLSLSTNRGGADYEKVESANISKLRFVNN